MRIDGSPAMVELARARLGERATLRVHDLARPLDWAADGKVWRDDWEVRFWRLPLTETSAEIAAAGFLVERIVEPHPSEALAQRFPEVYAKLAERPSFILFRLLRPST